MSNRSAAIRYVYLKNLEKETSDNPISYKILIDIGFQYLDHRLERHCSTF